MKLLFIYGPPAAGKLTIDQGVADRTNFRLFHNHLTIDLVEKIFEDREIRNEVVFKLRLDIIMAAAKADIDLIFTMVYAKPEDDDKVAKIVAAVEGNGGKVCFVQLIPDTSELERRVLHSSRQSFSKIKDPTTLRDLMTSYDLYSSVPFASNLTVNNTALTPSIVAEQVIDHFKLTPKKPSI